MPILGVLDPLTDDQRASLEAALAPGTSVRVVANDASALADAAVILSYHADLDEAVLAKAPALRAVIKIDSYTGSLDESGCVARGVAVHRVPMISLISVAEHTVMLMLALEKRLVEAEQRLRAGTRHQGVEPAITDQDNYAYNWVGLERFEALCGRRVGLVGLGTIGRAVAERLRAFQAEVIAATRRPLTRELEELGIRRVPFDELLSTSDHVSLHVKFEPANERMMGADQFRSMKPGAFFINTARGRLVDEEALAAVLQSGHLAGAALDVFWYEPLKRSSPLLHTPNTILTPHTAGIPAGILHPAEIPLIAAAAQGYLDGS